MVVTTCCVRGVSSTFAGCVWVPGNPMAPRGAFWGVLVAFGWFLGGFWGVQNVFCCCKIGYFCEFEGSFRGLSGCF